jgi:UPF0716 protein FxsA
MGWLIIVGLVMVPVVEIMAWMRLADSIGGWPTLFVSVAAVLLGMMILRRQGLAMLLDARARLEQGEVPVRAVFDGLCLAAAGMLLALPGLVSDVFALPLLLAPVRTLLFLWVGRRVTVVSTAPPPQAGPVIIEAEYEIIEPEHKRLEP